MVAYKGGNEFILYFRVKESICLSQLALVLLTAGCLFTLRNPF